MTDDHTKHIQRIYDEWRAADAVLTQKREEHYEAAARRNELYKALHEAVTPGDEIVVAHDADHRAVITADYHRAMPGHRMTIKVEGQKTQRSTLTFGIEPEGEKITRGKM